MSFVTCRLTGRMGNNIMQIMTTMAHSFKHGLDYKIPPFVKSKFTNTHPFDNLPKLSKLDEARIKYEHYFDGWTYKEIPNRENMRISGWYQNYRYFHEYRDRIIKEFNLPGEKIDAVAVHFRAGDYRLYPDKYPLMPKEYYEQALSMFDGKEIHVFSDEREEAMSRIPGADFYIIPRDGYADWLLMSRYKYFIIGNSTYSYTAAYLSGSNNVVSPHHENWYNENNKHIFTGELIPPEWEQIKLC